MFYVLIFSLAAVILIFAFVSMRTKRRRTMEYGEEPASHAGSAHHSSKNSATSSSARRNRKAQRAQSRHDRRKRH